MPTTVAVPPKVALAFAVLLGIVGQVGGVVEQDGFCKGSNAKLTCCKDGHGLILPIFPREDVWNRNFRAALYLAGLLWCFLGVSVLSDTFMAGIEAITNSTYKKKVKRMAADGHQAKDEQGHPIYDYVDEVTWNPAVANLTLMALGSSTPEILLSIIEIVGDNFYAGDLGPGTVVGSASYNLYVITGICMVALEPGEVRRIEGIWVYMLTATHSLFAYVWLALIITVISPDVVEWWEAAITFLAMPWLVTLVYLADKYTVPPSKAQVHPEIEASKDPNGPMEEQTGMNPTATSSGQLEDEEPFVRVTSGPHKKATYLDYRRKSCAVGAGALKSAKIVPMPALEPETGPSTQAKELIALKAAISESFHILTHCVYHWETATYGFPEIEGTARLTMLRTGKIDDAGKIRFRTQDLTAKSGLHYESREVVVEFEANEKSKNVFVPLIHDYEHNSDLVFHVLLEPMSAGGQIDHRSCRTAVTIIDSDAAGMFAWSKANNQVYKRTDSKAFLIVERRAALSDNSFSRIKTHDGSALASVHYKPVDLVLEWKPYELNKQISVRLLQGEGIRDGGGAASADDSVWLKRFFVDVTQVGEDGAENFGENSHTASVRIDHRATGKGLGLGCEEEVITWGMQIKQALNVNGGGDLADATGTDCAMHYITLGWKVLAAVVPPAHYLGGWACFSVSLCLIGVVTAFIGDLASIFGCLVGMKDTVTAFTIVALGTSLPDTFASMLAIRADDNADNAVGNITGSNSVNVFLGLGFPWLMAAIYWEVTGATDLWHERYGGGKWRHYDKWKDTGAFVVEGGSLGFNTMIFSILTCLVFFGLWLRRIYVGGEIGGSRWGARLSAAMLVLFWCIYVIVSALQVYNPDAFIAI